MTEILRSVRVVRIKCSFTDTFLISMYIKQCDTGKGMRNIDICRGVVIKNSIYMN